MDDTSLRVEHDSASSDEQATKKSTNKSHMEKKRRERINRSLGELKALVLGSIKKDASYYSKLEKADILEMTVEHVRFLQTQINQVDSCDPLPSARYRAGFATCATEMTRLLSGLPGVEDSIRVSLLKRLSDSCSPSPALDGATPFQQQAYASKGDTTRRGWEQARHADPIRTEPRQKENLREKYEHGLYSRNSKKTKLKGDHSPSYFSAKKPTDEGESSQEQRRATQAVLRQGSPNWNATVASSSGQKLSPSIAFQTRKQHVTVSSPENQSDVWRPW